MIGFDLTFLVLVVPALILGLYAQAKVQGAYTRWSRVGSRSGITGREAADFVMRKAGITNVQIVSTPGHLTDHYDPLHKRLVLSEENYHGSSLAAVGVAAHEAGHAIQHAVGYKMLKLRMSLVPVTQFASSLLPIVMFGGLFLGAGGMVFGNMLFKLGAVIYLVLTLFQLVTLPVEFDASRRAREELVATGILARDEMGGVAKTLNAAALTYVAAFVSSLAYLFYFLSLSRRE